MRPRHRPTWLLRRMKRSNVMTKTIPLTFVLILALILAACESTGDDPPGGGSSGGGSAGNKPSAGDSMSKSPVDASVPTGKSGNSADSKPSADDSTDSVDTSDPTDESGIVGVWVDDPFRPEINLDDYGLGSWIVFNRNGTYHHYHHYRVARGYVTERGVLTETGRYAIEGDKLRVTDRRVSLFWPSEFQRGSREEYNSKPVPDALLPFKCEESFCYSAENPASGGVVTFSGLPGLWINMSPDVNGNGFMYGRKINWGEIKGIFRWPGGLPKYLYPAGHNGIVFCIVPMNVSDLYIEQAFINKRSKIFFQLDMPRTTEDDLKPYLKKLTANGFKYDAYQYENVLTIHGTKYKVVIQPFSNSQYNKLKMKDEHDEYAKIWFTFEIPYKGVLDSN